MTFFFFCKTIERMTVLTIQYTYTTEYGIILLTEHLVFRGNTRKNK